MGLRDGLRARLSETQASIGRLREEADLLDRVSELFRLLIDTEVTIGIQAVEKLQTEGLRSVFDDQDLSVRSVVDIQRGKVSVDLITVQRQGSGPVPSDPDGDIEGASNDAFGGAVSTVESVLLRVAIILRRGLRMFMWLDETLPAFDSQYVVNMGRFLSVLCKRLHMDILCVTHNHLLADAADKRYHVAGSNGVVRFLEGPERTS